MPRSDPNVADAPTPEQFDSERRLADRLPAGVRIGSTCYRRISLYRSSQGPSRRGHPLRRNPLSRIIWQVSPSAISGYDKRYDDLLNCVTATPRYQDLKDNVTIETNYGYQFVSGTFQPSELTTTLPAVPLIQNGSGVSATTKQNFDALGNLTETTDERGTRSSWTYDVFTGAMTQSILDFGSGKQNLTSDFDP